MKQFKTIVIMLMVLFVMSVAASATEMVILHRTDRDCETHEPLPEVNDGNEQVFEVGVDAGYGNYECENRYQEQCIDDGSFNHYYYEWCEYITVPSKLSCSVDQMIGDVNGNGQITAGDAKLLDKALAEIIDGPDNICCVDVDQNGEYNVGDAIKINRIAAGLEASPGVCEEEPTCKANDEICSSDSDCCTHVCVYYPQDDSISPGLCKANPGVQCTSTDAVNDYSTKGTIFGKSKYVPTWETAEDMCYKDMYGGLPKKLVEYNCNNDVVEATAYDCPIACDDGVV